MCKSRLYRKRSFKFHSENNLLQMAALLKIPETLKYWAGVQQSQSNLMGGRCLFSLSWPPF